MTAFLQAINPNLWPIWARLMAAMATMILIPSVIAFVVVEREVRTVDRENLNAYLLDRGTQQRDTVTDNFSRIRAEARNFATADAQRGYILRLLVFGSNVPEVLNSLANYIDERMIGLGLFDGVRLVDLDGVVQFSRGFAILGGFLDIAAPGDDERNSNAYRAFQAAIELGEASRWAIDIIPETGDARIEIVRVVSNADGPVGYIAGSVNVPAVVYDVLARADVFVQTDSYLATGNQDTVTTPEYFDFSRQSVTQAPISQALAQRSGLENYTINGVDYIAYFAPILDTPFAIIVETPVAISFVATLDRIYDQGLLIVGVLVLFGAFSGLMLSQTILPPLGSLQEDMQAMGDGDFDKAVATAERSDEIGKLAQTFTALREQVRSVVEDQASRIAARVRDLQATQEVSRFAVNQRDLQPLMNNVVGLIVQSFPNIYHAQIFMIDEDRQYALLRASTGAPGRQLLDRGHRLGVGSQSVIGQVTEEGRVVIARDTTASDVHRRNEFLPDTRAELAVPLRIGDEIIGALDVQSKQGNSFTEDQVNILETMAGQIAIAIENSRLYEESVRRLEEINAANRDAARISWREYLNQERQKRISSEAGTYNFGASDDSLRQRAITEGVSVIGERTPRNTIPFAVPVKLSGQVLGAAEWELPVADFSREKVQLAEELVSRLAVGLDNARLFQASQRAATRERLVNEISAKLSGQTDIEGILRVAVREVGQALRAPQVQISLSADDEPASGKDGKNGKNGKA